MTPTCSPSHFFNLFFQPDLGGFCIAEPKCMLQLGQRCTFVNFCKFFDVLMLIVFFSLNAV